MGDTEKRFNFKFLRERLYFMRVTRDINYNITDELVAL